MERDKDDVGEVETGVRRVPPTLQSRPPLQSRYGRGKGVDRVGPTR